MSAAEFTIIRTLQAPRELVWRCLSERDRFMQWWGPASHATRAERFEFRPGGICHYSMSAGGDAMWGRFVYLEIEAPRRLVFINAFSDAGGALHRAPWEPRWPLEMHNTLTLDASGDQTSLKLVVRPVGDDEAEAAVFREGIDDMQVGFGHSLDQLAGLLARP